MYDKRFKELTDRVIRSVMNGQDLDLHNQVWDLVCTAINKREWTVQEADAMNQRMETSALTVSNFIKEIKS